MSDRYNQDMILGYVEGELDDAQREAFEATLAEDHELRTLVSQMKLDRESLRELGRTTAPVGLIDQVIQTQERAELLGDPEVPEPMPLTMPVNSRRFRRVLVYSGIAAILLISAAVVIPTLMPSELVNHEQYALNNPLAPQEDTDFTDSDSELAFTEPNPDTFGDAMPEQPVSDTLVARIEDAEELAEAMLDQPAEKPAPERPAEAIAARETTPSIETSDAESEPEVELADATVPTETDTTVNTLADAESTDVQPIKETSETTQVADSTETTGADQPEVKIAAGPVITDPFMGYADDDKPAITDNTQLLINTASLTLARREVRDWAMNNSAVVIEQPAEETIANRALAGGGAGQPITQTKLVVEIKEEQVPELLAYLNRAQGQKAELVVRADKPQLMRDDQRLVKRAEPRPVRDPNRTDGPTALANRPTRLPTARPATGIVTGLAPSEPAPNTTTTPQPEASSHEPAAKEAESPLPEEQPAQPTPFDWDSIFDSLKVKPIQPRHTPLLQSEPTKRLRLNILIQQVADEGTGDSPDPTRTEY